MTFATTILDTVRLREEIRREYREVARRPHKGFHFHTGRKAALLAGYRRSWLDSAPKGALESYAGTGNPFSIGLLRPGETVLDLGCGSGLDTFLAARQVGPDGVVLGIDMTREMVEKATAVNALPNVEFRIGQLEQLPVPDAWADVIVSNGTINLCPDKHGAFAEMWRVLKPGGRVQISDILLRKEVEPDAKKEPHLWTG